MEKNVSIEQDKVYLSRLNDGDKKAFDAIFHKYYLPLCAYAYQYVVFDDVEEIVQDLLLWIWQNHNTLFIKTSLSAYLYRAVHLRCLSKIEQNTTKQRNETLYWQCYVDEISHDTSEYQTEELLRRIHEAINKLPEKYRQAFVMHRFRNRSYKEIAEKLNVSPKTVDYRIQQALKLLREDLKEFFPLLLLLYKI